MKGVHHRIPNQTPSAIANNYGVPWYDVQIGESIYTVYLDLTPGNIVSGPLDQQKHGAILQHIYVVDASNQQLVTDPEINKYAALLAQNRAIVQTSYHWMNRLSNVNHVTFYPDLVDDEGRVFEIGLPSSVTSSYAQTLISGRLFGKNLRNADVRRDYYKEVVRASVFPVLENELIADIEAEFTRDLSNVLQDAYDSAAQSSLPPNKVGWASHIASYMQANASIALHVAGKSTTFIDGFGAFLAGFGTALTVFQITDEWDQTSLESMLQTAYMQAMGEERLAALVAMVQNPTSNLDPAFVEAVFSLQADIAQLDETTWADTLTIWFQEDTVGHLIDMAGIVVGIAAIFAPPGAIAVVVAVAVYETIRVGYEAWQWLDNRDDLVSVAGVAKTVEYVLRSELENRFSMTPPTSQELESWLIISNMRLYTDQMFYSSLLNRLDWYDSFVYFIWIPLEQLLVSYRLI